MENNCLLSTTRSFINKLPVYVVALCVFLVNLAGYTGFRYLISDDIFGGDTVNTVVGVMDSYVLKESSIINPASFYPAILKGKNKDPKDDHNSFVYHLLSRQGRDVLERLAKDLSSERDRGIFLFEFNRSVVDNEINWPTSFLQKLSKDPYLNRAGKHYYNLIVLSSLYPDNIRHNLNPLFQWKYDLSSLINVIPKLSFGYFTINTPTRYSPLVSIYTSGVQMFLQNSPERTIIAIFLTGIIYATLMLVIFLLAFKLIKSIPWSLIAVFLFQASVSTILISNQLFSLPYLFVPLVMVSAIYAYLQYKDSGRIGRLILFFALSIIGPWFREFPGAIPFIVFASEILSFKGRRSVVILLICIPLMLHSVYPSLLPWFIGLNEGGVYNAFSGSHVKHVTSSGINWDFIGFLFVQFPPVLWLIMAASIGYWLRRKFLAGGKGDARNIVKTAFKITAILLLIAVIVGFSYYVLIVNKNLGHIKRGDLLFYLIYLTAFIFIGFISLVSLRFNRILPIYFLASFTPFLKLGLAELHLSFTLIPLAIIFSLWFKDLFSSLSNGSGSRKTKIALTVLAGLLVIGLADHFMNIPSSLSAQKRMAETNKEMGLWLKNNTPRHSIVVTNFYNFTDVFYYSNYHFDPYETVENCPMGPTQVVHKNKDFETLLNRNFGVRDVYLLAAEHEFRDKSKEAYHSHKYVKSPPGEIEKLAEFPSRTVYYYLDPLKYFVPKHLVSFIGYMDWSTDFYYGNTRFPFRRIVYADYVLYRLKDVSKGFADEEPQKTAGVSPPILVGDYKGYNIVDYLGSFYGVAQSMGPLDLSKDADRNLKGIVVGKDRREIERLIDKEIINREENAPPVLVGDYKGYNIVKYGGQFYGVPQSLGPLDLSKEGDRSREGILAGKDRKEVEQLIDNDIQSKRKARAAGYSPQLVGAYKGYNIVDYNNQFYGVAQSMGPLDLSKKEDRSKAGILVGKEIKEVEQLIDKAIQSQPKEQPKAKTVDQPPILIGAYQGYNIVDYRGQLYGVPQSLGPLDLSREKDRNRKGIVVSNDRKALEHLIDKEIKKKPNKIKSK